MFTHALMILANSEQVNKDVARHETEHYGNILLALNTFLKMRHLAIMYDTQVTHVSDNTPSPMCVFLLTANQTW